MKKAVFRCVVALCCVYDGGVSAWDIQQDEAEREFFGSYTAAYQKLLTIAQLSDAAVVSAGTDESTNQRISEIVRVFNTRLVADGGLVGYMEAFGLSIRAGDWLRSPLIDKADIILSLWSDLMNSYALTKDKEFLITNPTHLVADPVFVGENPHFFEQSEFEQFVIQLNDVRRGVRLRMAALFTALNINPFDLGEICSTFHFCHVFGRVLLTQPSESIIDSFSRVFMPVIPFPSGIVDVLFIKTLAECVPQEVLDSKDVLKILLGLDQEEGEPTTQANCVFRGAVYGYFSLQYGQSLQKRVPSDCVNAMPDGRSVTRRSSFGSDHFNGYGIGSVGCMC
jgi:hypothetical protein